MCRALLALTILLASTTAASGQARETGLEVLLFNEDMTKLVVKYQDSLRGTSIQIRQMKTNKILKDYEIQDSVDERKRLKRLKRTYKIEVHKDQQNPKKSHTAMGAPDGSKGYNVLIMQGKGLGVLGTVPLKKDEDGTIAKGMLKEVNWTPDGRMVVAVINQKIQREDGLEDVDEIYYFRFRAWKVKWITPPEEDAEDETTPGSASSGDGSPE